MKKIKKRSDISAAKMDETIYRVSGLIHYTIWGAEMTRKELSRLYVLSRDIEQIQKLIEEKEAQIEKLTAQLTGMPRPSSQISYAIEELIDMTNMLVVKKREAEIVRSMGERFIYSIDDPLIRTILSLRYLENLSWNQIAMKIGGNNTADSVRMAEARFWKKERKK